MSTDITNSDFVANPVALDLAKALSQLDASTAALLERAVRDALALAEEANGTRFRDRTSPWIPGRVF